jgi:hypothetical protein
MEKPTTTYCGCALCGRPTELSKDLCNLCERDIKSCKPSAIIYEFPTGKILNPPTKREILTLKK